MTDKAISPLRQRLVEDMAIRQLGPQGSARVYPPCQKLCEFRWPVSRQGQCGGRPPIPAAAGIDWNDGADRRRQCQCPAVLL